MFLSHLCEFCHIILVTLMQKFGKQGSGIFIPLSWHFCSHQYFTILFVLSTVQSAKFVLYILLYSE